VIHIDSTMISAYSLYQRQTHLILKKNATFLKQKLGFRV
jgi:hypothetical protein